MNNLTTRKIVLGMLMTLVLAFSVQGVCEALTLSATSDTTQIKEPNDAPFEIQFTVGLTTPTSVNDNANPSRRVTDHNIFSTDPTADVSITDTSQATRIDSNGYKVFYIGSTAYRRTDAAAVENMFPTGNNADLTLGSSTTHASIGQDPVSPYYVNASNQVFDSNGASVYIRQKLKDATPANEYDTYTRATANPIAPVDVKYRFDYNEEAIKISVAPDASAGNIEVSIKGSNYFLGGLATGADLTEASGVLRNSLTLVCDTTTAGTYTITVEDSTLARDFPWNAVPVEGGETGLRRSKITFTLHVTTETVATGNKIEAKTLTGGTTLYLRVDTGKAIEHISDDFVVTPVDGNLEIRYRIASGSGTLYAAETSTTGTYKGPSQDLTVHQSANVFLNTNGTSNEVAASIAGSDRQTFSGNDCV